MSVAGKRETAGPPVADHGCFPGHPAPWEEGAGPEFLFPTFFGGANVNCLSGTHFFLLRAARKAGLPLRPVSIPFPDEMRVARLLWRAKRVLALRQPRGFTMSAGYLSTIWDAPSRFPPGSRILSTFGVVSPELLARAERGDIQLSYYIDLTYQEYVSAYQEGKGADPVLIRRSLELEARGYRAAHRVVSFSRASASFITGAYGIDPGKVFVVPPGANMEDAVADALPPTDPSPGSPFVVGFVGMDWRRKRLDLLARAVAQLRAEGEAVVLRVVGDASPETRAMDGVEFLGRIDKATDMRTFAAFLSGCDLGALLSEAEALGISLLEFLRVGRPVLTCSVGGMPDVVTPDVGVLVSASPDQHEVADALRGLLRRGGDWERLKANAVRRRQEFSWNNTAKRLAGILRA